MRGIGRVAMSFAVLALAAWALPAAAQQKPNDKIQAKLSQKLAANPGSGRRESRPRRVVLQGRPFFRSARAARDGAQDRSEGRSRGAVRRPRGRAGEGLCRREGRVQLVSRSRENQQRAQGYSRAAGDRHEGRGEGFGEGSGRERGENRAGPRIADDGRRAAVHDQFERRQPAAAAGRTCRPRDFRSGEAEETHDCRARQDSGDLR